MANRATSRVPTGPAESRRYFQQPQRGSGTRRSAPQGQGTPRSHVPTQMPPTTREQQYITGSPRSSRPTPWPTAAAARRAWPETPPPQEPPRQSVPQPPQRPRHDTPPQPWKPIPLSPPEGEPDSVLAVMSPGHRAVKPEPETAPVQSYGDPGAWEPIARMNRETLPPRRLWAKGYGAWGQFVAARSMQEYTSADFLSQPGKVTPVLARFSLCSGGPGSADSRRDIHGMAVRFYTDQGNFDLLCQDAPVALIGDGALLPELTRALGAGRDSGLYDSLPFWQFCAAHPETLHGLSWLYDKGGLRGSFRGMPGWCPCTYVLGTGRVRHLARFSWIPHATQGTLTPEEARRLAWEDPDVAGRDLREAIDQGQQIAWDLAVQIMSPATGGTLEFDPCSASHIWPAERYPLTVLGTLTLDKNPESHYTQVEQADFAPGHLVPGIGLCRCDRLLGALAFAAADGHRHRLGGREPQVNQCRGGGRYHGVMDTPEPQRRISDPYGQAGARYRAMNPEEQFAMTQSLSADLALLPGTVVEAMLGHIYAAEPEWYYLTLEHLSPYGG